MNRTFAIWNFGCKVNQEEGGALASLFADRGWQRAEATESPALIIINTCTVTQTADKKARNLIRRLREQHPAAILAVCGCYAQRAATEIAAIPGVDIIAGVEERAHLPELAERYAAEKGGLLAAVGDIAQADKFRPIAAASSQSRARAYLKIEDGCDQFCRYCIIPHVRGPVRSLPLAQALALAQALVADGHAEIVLSGIHIGAYGRDLGPGEDLPALLQRLCGLDGLERLRLGSIEPQQFSEQLLAVIAAQPKICRHLHIPLQSGSDRVLAAMGRRYGTQQYAALLARLRVLLDDPAITSDVMTGFPGESGDDHQDSLRFCRQMGFAGLHIFPYSRRQGTPAAQLPGQVRQAEKARRAAQLAEVAATGRAAYMRRWLARELEFLAEERVELADGIYWRGHSGNYLPLLLAGSGHPGAGLIRVRAESMAGDALLVSRLA